MGQNDYVGGVERLSLLCDCYFDVDQIHLGEGTEKKSAVQYH